MTSRSRLLLTWVILMALTAGSLTAAEANIAGAVSNLGLIPVAVILAAGLFKARQILWNFLDLRRSTAVWKGTFLAFLTVLCLVLYAAYAASLAGAS